MRLVRLLSTLQFIFVFFLTRSEGDYHNKLETLPETLCDPCIWYSSFDKVIRVSGLCRPTTNKVLMFNLGVILCILIH